MPSFFRTAEDVRIFFLNETDTPEKKKQHARLKTIFAQSIRRGGVKGSFFFHRRSASLGGAPILILEPQGPVDRGIFQEGLTRFGETLSGTFHTPRPGHIVLEPTKNLSDADILKYQRAIRRVIARMTGMMASGGDDRVKIVTPAHKAQRAREDAAQRREAAEAAREERRALQEARAEKRAQDKTKRARPAAAPQEPQEQEPAPTLEERVAAHAAAARKQAATAEAGVALVRDGWAEALIGWEQLEGDGHHLEAERIEVAARVAAHEEHDALLNHLKHRLAPLQRADQLHAALAELRDDPRLAELLSVLEVSDEPLETARRWVRDAQARLPDGRADQERLREVERSLQAGRSALERGRQEAVQAQAEAIRDRIRAANQRLNEALQARDDAARAAAGQALAEAQAALQVVSRLQRADSAMRWIGMSLQRMADRGQTTPEDFAAQQGADAALRQALAQLASEAAALRRLGAGALLEVLWQSRPALSWARPMVEARLG